MAGNGNDVMCIPCARCDQNQYNIANTSKPMEEAEIKKEYDEVLAVYSHKRSQCQNMERQIPILQAQIQQLRSRVKDFLPPSPPLDHAHLQHAEQQKQQLISQYKDLTGKLNRIELQISSGQDPDILALESELQKQEAANSSFTFTDCLAQVQNQQQALSLAQKYLFPNSRNLDSRQAQLKEAQLQFSKEDAVRSSLQKQIASLKNVSQQSSAKSSPSPQNSNLQLQLQKLEEEERGLLADLKKEEEALDERKRKADNQNKAKQEQLNQANARNAQLQSSLEKLEEELKNIQKAVPKKGKDTEQKELEEQNKSLRKEVDALKKELVEASEELEKKRSTNKKERNQASKNYRKEINDQHTYNQLQTKELDREKDKLENTVKVRKTYVSQQNLQILQKEFERHQLKSKPNLQAEEGKREKLIREKETIRSRIDFLIDSSRKLEQESEARLRELKQKGDQLVKEKLSGEKHFNQATYKLNQYMKAYPDHEKKKEEAKNEEKKKKQAARDLAKKEQQQEKEASRKRKEKREEERLIAEEEDRTAWEEWNQWEQAGHLPKKDQKSFFNNRQFQMAAGAVAVVAMLALSFS